MLHCGLMAKYEIEALVNEHCVCGENPLWDEQKKLLFWEDIPNGFIFEFNPQTGTHRKIYDGDLVGGFTFQSDGKLLLFRDHNIALLEDDGTARVLTREVPESTGRFNDVIADPEGRVFAGTGGDASCDLCCGLLRVDPDATVTELFRGTTCSNGMGFTPDLKQMYWTDSTARKIFIFDYDRASGQLENRREFYSAPAEAKTPDGMAVDAEGCVWSAHWDGFGVFRLDPTGKLMEKIELPVGKVTSVAFGGDSLDELYITTAGGTSSKNQPVTEDTPDGTLYRVHVGVKGQPEFRSRIAVN